LGCLVQDLLASDEYDVIMTENKQPRMWIDSRLIRPAGWSPPKPNEQDYSRLFSALEGAQKQTFLAGILPSLKIEAEFADKCLLFYTNNHSHLKAFGDYWTPWRRKGGVLPHLETDMQEFYQPWLPFMESLETVNQECAKILATFFNLPAPKNEWDYLALRDQVEVYRNEYGAVWVYLPDFQPLILQLQETIAGMQQLLPKLNELLQSLYPQLLPGNPQALFVNQKVKNQIDAARDEPIHQRAIKMLKRALQENPTGIQTSVIYMELGSRFSELGKIEQAIENYTESIDRGKLSQPLVHFWRGELYYHQREWDKPIQDFKQAIVLEIYSPERERAQLYISELRSMSRATRGK